MNLHQSRVMREEGMRKKMLHPEISKRCSEYDCAE
jgi:hypothetical protein